MLLLTYPRARLYPTCSPEQSGSLSNTGHPQDLGPQGLFISSSWPLCYKGEGHLHWRSLAKRSEQHAKTPSFSPSRKRGDPGSLSSNTLMGLEAFEEHNDLCYLLADSAGPKEALLTNSSHRHFHHLSFPASKRLHKEPTTLVHFYVL